MAAARVRLERSDGAVIASHVEVADTVWRRFVGLMGRRVLTPDEGLYLRPCSSIHMLFMRFAIDAVFVDQDGVVLRIYAPIKPWRMTGVVRRAKACIELAAGTCAAAGITPGDRLRLAG